MASATQTVVNFLGTGINLIPLPTSPSFRQIDFSPTDSVTLLTSPYTQQAQALQWPGAEYWKATVTLPYLTKAQAKIWTATLQGMQGVLHAFQIGDQLYSGPTNVSGIQGGNPIVDGSNSGQNLPGTNTLHTTGWAPSTFDVLSVGDYLQIGYRLYRVIGANANSDINGNVIVTVWPSLREQPAGGASIDVINPVGIFRRTSNTLNWSEDYNGFVSLSFGAMEVR
jgi:hypothetical protein